MSKLSKTYNQYFLHAKRNNGEKFIKLNEEHPLELVEFMRQLHKKVDQTFPNDWIYKITYEAFLEFELEGAEIETMVIESDIWCKESADWLADNTYAREFCNMGLEEGLAETKDICEIIECGQWLAKKFVYQQVWEFIEKQA